MDNGSNSVRIYEIVGEVTATGRSARPLSCNDMSRFTAMSTAADETSSNRWRRRERDDWYPTRWVPASGVEATQTGVRTERRQLAVLGVLAGLVFFGSATWGAASVARNSKARQHVEGQLQPQNQEFQEEDIAVTSSLNAALDINMAADLATSDEGEELFKIHVYNSYTKDDPIQLYKWEYMAEPHKPTRMELLNWPEASDQLDYR